MTKTYEQIVVDLLTEIKQELVNINKTQMLCAGAELETVNEEIKKAREGEKARIFDVMYNQTKQILFTGEYNSYSRPLCEE